LARYKGYKKKRARELKHDRFRDTAMTVFDRIAQRLEGKGRQILYAIAGVVLIAAAVYGGVRWRQRRAQQAEQALGRAISLSTARVTASPEAGSKDVTFTSEQERAQRAIEEFEKVAAKYGEPYRSEARYLMATNLLVVDRAKGVGELESLSKGAGEVAALASFALAQAKENDGQYDEAAALYRELARQGNLTVVTPETANLRLAIVYEKQGKKKESADLLFEIISQARQAKDPDGKPIPESSAASQAAQELQKVDPTRYGQLPAAVPPSELL
jgi:hypothetical protein